MQFMKENMLCCVTNIENQEIISKRVPLKVNKSLKISHDKAKFRL